MIMAFFGSLRHAELMELQVERVSVQSEGVYVTHCCVKQRSDKMESKFLVPRGGDVNYAAVVEDYLCTIKNTLGVFKGRLFYTGTPDKFVQTLVGKNIVSKFPGRLQFSWRRRTQPPTPSTVSGGPLLRPPPTGGPPYSN